MNYKSTAIRKSLFENENKYLIYKENKGLIKANSYHLMECKLKHFTSSDLTEAYGKTEHVIFWGLIVMTYLTRTYAYSS